MDLSIEQPCPSCGAEITLSEDDRLILCPFCDVANYRVGQTLPRYVLPARLPSLVDESSLFHVPYLRFKGCIYSISRGGISHRLLDTTRLGCKGRSLPVSLGLRPQAMKLRPVTASMSGSFVRQTAATQTMFDEAARIAKAFTELQKPDVSHRAFIGETISRVYLPVYTRGGMLYDGITHARLGGEAAAERLRNDLLVARRDWEPRYISTLCPECGAGMQGGRDSLVVVCDGCDRQWGEEKGRFEPVDYAALPSMDQDTCYLPFWLIYPLDERNMLKTFAQFLELTNQPQVIRKVHEETKFSMILPAFKLNPSLYLQAAKMATVGQLQWQPVVDRGCIIPAGSVYPVTLPHKEAAEAMKTLLVASAVSMNRVLDQLPLLKFTGYRKQLFYLPFSDRGHDFIEQYSGMAINAAALRFGRAL